MSHCCFHHIATIVVLVQLAEMSNVRVSQFVKKKRMKILQTQNQCAKINKRDKYNHFNKCIHLFLIVQKSLQYFLCHILKLVFLLFYYVPNSQIKQTKHL